MLEFEDSDRKQRGSEGVLHTATEIDTQPELWQAVFDLILSKKQSITGFLSPLLNLKDLRIILTGAGSSAFVGESVQRILQVGTQKITQAIATTDLVTHPQSFFLKDIPTLLVSFARSGNSPESVEAVRLANIYCDKIFHLVITCNKDGELAQSAGGKEIYTLILPEAANDKGLAMTGSFTSMLLSITLIAKLDKIENLQSSLNQMKINAGEVLHKYLPSIKEVVKMKFDRVIFLGSGPLLGIAHECHLKLQELTDGQVICKYDSFLGFRHGPRAVTNESSLIIYLFSQDDHVFWYEKDLVESIAADSIFLPTISFGRNVPFLKNSILDIEFANPPAALNEFYFITAVLLGQLLGLYKSLELGLQPDNPSVTGAISRVVEGVTIYPIESKSNDFVRLS